MRLRNGNWWVLFVLTSFFLSSCARVARRDGVDALQKPSAKTETAWGLHTVTFETLQGRIRVNLPDDMAAGDSVSGSVIGEPGGETETERRQNADHLNGYVVEINKTKTPVFRKVLKWTIPAALIGRETAVPAILRDNEGKEVATVMVPIQPTPPPIEQPTTPVPGDYHLPRIGQAGKSIQISGPFDSDFKTTRVRVRGEQLQLLAQSPRKAIVDSPLDVVGPTEIEIREGDVVANGPNNNLRLSLKAGQTSLTGGERTTLTAEMSGLEELDQDVS